MAGNEVRNQLLPQILFGIDTVEYLFEFSELSELPYPHDVQYPVTCVFRCYLQSAADMLFNEFTRIFSRTAVYDRIFALVQ